MSDDSPDPGTSAWPVAEIRLAEEVLMAQLPDGELMRRAAFGLATRCAQVLVERTGRVYGARVLILAGAGNNGGDARLAGELLARRGAVVRAVSSHVSETEPIPDLILDGLVGIGGRGPLRATTLPLVEFTKLARSRGAYIVAVDVPSGVASDTGEVPALAITADETVAFGCLKQGLITTPGAWRAGRIHYVDIGLGFSNDPSIRLADGLSWPPLNPAGNKYTRGVVGVAAGSAQYPGAAFLAVQGALAGGAGMVRYVGPVEVTQRYPEVVATQQFGQAGAVQSWVVGPGIGVDDAGRRLVAQVLASAVPAVIDAGGLGCLTDELRARILRRKAPTVLTPHEGEFTRLFGPITGGRLQAAMAAARVSGAVIVLKGDRTIVTSGSRPAWVGPHGAAALASAGTGDLLAGLVGAAIAAEQPVMSGVALAVATHAVAARETTGRVTASDIGARLKTT